MATDAGLTLGGPFHTVTGANHAETRQMDMGDVDKILRRLCTMEDGTDGTDATKFAIYQRCFAYYLDTEKFPFTLRVAPEGEILRFGRDNTSLEAQYDLEIQDMEENLQETDPDEEMAAVYSVLQHIHRHLQRQENAPDIQGFSFFHICDVFYDVLQKKFIGTQQQLQGGVAVLREVIDAWVPNATTDLANRLETFGRTRNDISSLGRVADLISEHGPHDYQRLFAMVTGFVDFGNQSDLELPHGYLVFTLKTHFDENGGTMGKKQPSTPETVTLKPMWTGVFSRERDCTFEKFESPRLDNTSAWKDLFHGLSQRVVDGVPNILIEFGTGRQEMYYHPCTDHERDEFVPGLGLEETLTELMTRRWPFQISFYIWKVKGIVKMYLGYADQRVRIRCHQDVHDVLARVASMVVIPLNETTPGLLLKLEQVFSAYPDPEQGCIRLIYLNKAFRDNLRNLWTSSGVEARDGTLEDFARVNGAVTNHVCLQDESFDSLATAMENDPTIQFHIVPGVV